ncbi:ATP-binding cassette domain-containing protein, partial [Oleiphilus sp. HI0086]
MSLLMKSSDPDSGVINFQKGLKVGALPQSMPDADERNVFDVVAEGLPEIGQVLSEYHHLINSQDEAADLQKLEKLQDRIESLNGWDFDTRIASMLKRFGLHESMQMKDLSGGWRRRVMLARALINEPDLLLLDEPTNHLDIETIKWLEARLAEYRGALLFVSHDRAFIKALASNIIELDRGNITAFNGGYSDYLKEKQRLLEEEERQNALFDKRLSEEEVWIRQGIKARRTRNEGRVRALKAMRDERKQRVNQQGKAEIKIAEAEKSGKLVAEAEHVSLAFDSGRKVIDDFSLTVMRGDRIGLIGANGAGKTTLLKVLLDQLKPTSGSVRLGSKLEVAYFDQLRGGLDFTKTVFDNVADGHDFVEMDGKSRHVMSYLNDFLFTAERARSPITALSGGETNRLLLARLFAKPANVI